MRPGLPPPAQWMTLMTLCELQWYRHRMEEFHL